MKIDHIYVMATALFLSLDTGAAHAKSGPSLNVPCEDEAKTTGCSVLKSCSQVIPSLVEQVERTLATESTAFKNGKILKFSESTKDHLATDSLDYKGAVCNLSQGEETRLKNPDARNSPAGGCGQLAEFDMSGQKDRPRDNSRESAYRFGASEQAKICAWRETEEELKTGKITVPAACQAMADDVRQHYLKTSQLAGGLEKHSSKNLCEQKNKEGIDFCKKETAANDLFEEPKYRITACYLSTAREAVEGAFADLVRCVVHAKADATYSELFTTKEAHNRIMDRMRTDITDPCLEESKSKCLSSLTPTCFTQAYTTCYQAKYPDFFANYLNENLPDGGKCKNFKSDRKVAGK